MMLADMESQKENPVQLCACGCGQPAPIAWRTNNGYRKGEVMRYLPDHYKITLEELAKREARRGTLEERFWRRVDKNGPIVKVELGPCWIWLGMIENGNGYGYLGAFTRRYASHVLSYGIHKGGIPKGFQVDHLCRNRGCCNPDHLEAVTIAVNVLRGDGVTARNAAKTHCKRGHEFTPENTERKLNKRTGRYGRACMTCKRETAKVYWRTVARRRKAERKERNGGIGNPNFIPQDSGNPETAGVSGTI